MQLGQHDDLATVRNNLHPEIFNRLRSPLAYDSSQPIVNFIHADDDESIPLINMPFEVMRKNLVNHFNYRWVNNDIKWPSRNGVIKLV
jgi:hypothetical protein